MARIRMHLRAHAGMHNHEGTPPRFVTQTSLHSSTHSFSNAGNAGPSEDVMLAEVTNDAVAAAPHAHSPLMLGRVLRPIGEEGSVGSSAGILGAGAAVHHNSNRGNVHAQTLAASPGAHAHASEGSMQMWQDAAVLVAVVADYPGLCRILQPAELTNVTNAMQSAFVQEVHAAGAVAVDVGAEVMTALMPPAAMQAARSPGNDRRGADGRHVVSVGARLAALQRLGRR